MYSDFRIDTALGQRGEGFLPLSNDTDDTHLILSNSGFTSDTFSIRKLNPDSKSSNLTGERVEGIFGYQQGQMQISDEKNGFAADADEDTQDKISGNKDVLYNWILQHQYFPPRSRHEPGVTERLESLKEELVTFKPDNVWSVENTESCLQALLSGHPRGYAYNTPTYQRQEGLGSGATLKPLTDWMDKDRYMTSASADCTGHLYNGNEDLGRVTTTAQASLVADIINPNDTDGAKGTVGFSRVLSMIPDRSANYRYQSAEFNPAW